MKIHEVLKSYLDFTSALIDTPEEIESYNILRDLEKRLTPKFERNDKVRIKESDDPQDDFYIEIITFEVDALQIQYEIGNDSFYLNEDLKLIEKGYGTEQHFEIGDKVKNIFFPINEKDDNFKEIKGTVCQILGEVCYIKTRTGKIYSIHQDDTTYDQS